MSDKQKILISGDVEGKFDILFSKVETINKKNGPFDFLLCVGNFFGDDNSKLEPYKSGIKKVPVRTFIIGPNREDDIDNYSNSEGSEICSNVTYLGKRGLFRADSGLKIAYVSGRDGDDVSKDIAVTENDVVSLRNSCLKGQPSFRGVDILLTSQWPIDITNFDPNEPKFQFNGSKLIAWLSAQIKPRYHVCGLEGIYYERPPYRNQSKNDNNLEIASRFISLARVGNPKKEKWLYALNLTPVDRTRLTELAIKTTDETQSPFGQWTLNSSPSETNNSNSSVKSQFFYDMDTNDTKRKSFNPNSSGRMKKTKIDFDQSKCWFCLSSPQVSKHLVIFVGSEVYIALARGGLVDDHFLILPVSHYQSLSTVSDSVDKEIQLSKEAIKNYYAETNRIPVFFERNYKTSHCQLQAVPVPSCQQSHLVQQFQEVAESQQFKLDPLDNSLRDAVPPQTTYFYVEFSDGEKLFYKIRRNFPLQFGREVLASSDILNLEDRIDWKDCQISEEEETQMAKNIRKKFQPFAYEL